MDQAGFDIDHVRPEEAIRACKIPTLFLCGTRDQLIPKHHSEILYQNHAGQNPLKRIVEMIGHTHNSVRPKLIY